MLPNLGLPLLTDIGAHHAKPIGGFGLVRPVFTIPYQFWQCGRVMDTVGMVLITIAYHMINLSLSRPSICFTNHYRRIEGLGMTEYYIGLELIVSGAIDEGDVMLFFIG